MKQGRKPGSLCRFSCCECGAIELVSGGSHYFRCSNCRVDGIASNVRDRNGKNHAAGRVAAAIKSGALSRPSTFPCFDCGGQATQYDHRDYNHPLRVEPVCRACNLNRGPAIPRYGSIDTTMALGFVPYKLKIRVRQLFSLLKLNAECLDAMPRMLGMAHWKTLGPILAAATSQDAHLSDAELAREATGPMRQPIDPAKELS